MRRSLVAKQVHQHRGEPIDRVRGLTSGGGEVLDGKRIEGPVGQGVTVEQEQLPATGHYLILGTCRTRRPYARDMAPDAIPEQLAAFGMGALAEKMGIELRSASAE